ncbi:MAG TPA: hypothetical protein VGC74_01115 [Stenotrophomonas sp.]|jgi:hypothetical protein
MAIDLYSLAWRLQRPFLRHGRFTWAALAFGLLLAMQATRLCVSAFHLCTQAAEPVMAAPVVRPSHPAVPALPLPKYGQRFELTREAIAAAVIGTPAPMKISFGYQSVPEAHLVRQTATFATQTRWGDLAPLLDRLQAVHRAAYISRLRLSREQARQPVVEAEVQLAIAYIVAPTPEAK